MNALFGSEGAAGILQAVITAGLAGLCAHLYLRFRKPYLGWWTAAWSIYVLRVGAILGFFATRAEGWLYWHQVMTGWTGLALLMAALVFARPVRWRRWFLVAVLFPPVWSYVAIYQMENFLFAAGPAVLFLSAATMWTGIVFVRHARRTGSSGTALLGWGFVVWALHHLDYPVLRARGAWDPWGYYLDILFVLVIGAGILLVVAEDLRRGIAALSALSAELQRGGDDETILDRVLGQPLALPGVTGTALFLRDSSGTGGMVVRGAGTCAVLEGTRPGGALAALLADAVAEGRPREGGDWPDAAWAHVVALPVLRGSEPIGAMLVAGDSRDPFTALDDDFLVALGRHVGAALENAELYRRLRERTGELERLSQRMVHQHEEQRRALSAHLHDETAQVFAAVKMQLGMVRERTPADTQPTLDRVLALVDGGLQGIRHLTSDLRPPLLDDLGLLPALRALAAEFGERSGLAMTVDAPPGLPPLPDDAELALYRALQEALSNVARHAGATQVAVRIAAPGTGTVRLVVEDDGRTVVERAALEGRGRMGLAGMRERITALGGSLRVEARPEGGVALSATIPVDGRGA